MKTTCLNCEKEFSVVPAEIKRGGGKYCSRKCKGLATKGKNNPNWKGGKIKFKCGVCGTVFTQYKSEYERINRKRKTEQRYCSKDCWAKGYFVHPEGYVYLYMPNHPDSISNGMILEHRYVMEQKIGERIDKDMIVHHINGDRADNRPSNLQLMTKSEHHKFHAQERSRDDAGKFTERDIINTSKKE